MTSIKRSMSVSPAPVYMDGVPIPASPPSHDQRWVKYDPDYEWSLKKWTGPWGYVIKRVTNSTEYRPGWLLTRAKVDELIAAGWTVSVLSKV